jgi:hypothetical protein
VIHDCRIHPHHSLNPLNPLNQLNSHHPIGIIRHDTVAFQVVL